MNDEQRDLERFYELLDELEGRLGGRRRLSECTGRQDWPARGVYFFFEPGECRAGLARSRVVRVGTHALNAGSRSTLWGRLRQHRGGAAGGGNHRGSVFRLHVGMALQSRYPGRWVVDSWARGSSAHSSVRAGERELEDEVSRYLGRMELLWLEVGDEPGPGSDRALLERGSIALLASAGAASDSPSPDWLGRSSPRAEVRRSGLWNVDHVNDRLEPGFLELFAGYLKRV